jgi:hypothetical protein
MNSLRDEVTTVDCRNDPGVSMGQPAGTWIEIDGSYFDGRGGVQRVAHLCQRASARCAVAMDRSFSVVGCSERTHIDDGRTVAPTDGGDVRACGRQYSLALLALLDALAAEPSTSPLATSTPLEDVRTTALVVAGESVASRPDPTVIDRAVRLADRRLADLRVPLRATGYLAARDALGQMVGPLLAERLAGGP